jgi:hypothetical protein
MLVSFRSPTALKPRPQGEGEGVLTDAMRRASLRGRDENHNVKFTG